MDVNNYLSSIPIAKNLINEVPKGQLTQAVGGGTGGSGVAPGTDISKLQTIDFSNRQGYREDYSIRDAADSLWRQETLTINLRDLDDPEKSGKFLENMRIQAREDLGIQGGGPTKEEVLNEYIQGLRQNGLDGSVNWSALSREFSGFKTTTPEELEDGLNYLASRYVAVQDKLERNFSGDELAAELAKLEETYQAGKSGMIDGYTALLQENLGVSDRDAQAVRDSFSALLDEKVDAYRGALEKVHASVAQSGPDGVWLKNHDAYMASQLRGERAAGQGGAKYSVQDLTAAGQIAQSYRTELSNASSWGKSEAVQALNVSLIDMKAETLIQKGLVSRNMADLLRDSRAQAHQNILDALDRTLAKWESTRAPGEPRGTYAPVDRSIFDGVYRAVMSAFQRSGDAAQAIRAGASAGQELTARASARNPKVLRWGNSSSSYWSEFYQNPADRKLSAWEIKINQMLAQSGQAPKPQCSAYQKYVNSWQEFLSSIGAGMDTRA